MGVNGFITLLFWLLVAVIVGVDHARKLTTEEERTRQLALSAEELGFEFLPRVEIETLYASNLDLFTQDYYKRIFNVMKARIEKWEVRIFDYEYFWPGNKITFRQSVMCLDLPEIYQPIFQQGYSQKVIQKLFVRELRKLGNNQPCVIIEFSQNYFICYRRNVRIAPNDMLPFVDEGLDAFMLSLEVLNKLQRTFFLDKMA